MVIQNINYKKIPVEGWQHFFLNVFSRRKDDILGAMIIYLFSKLQIHGTNTTLSFT